MGAKEKGSMAITQVRAEGPCPCGRLDPRGKPLSLARCCGPWLADVASSPAPDAESLMRSRYSAFVLEDGDYLLATWHASRRPPEPGFDAGTRWLGLEVRAHRVIDDSHAEVEFIARSRHAGRAQRLHERSRFVRENGRWYYLDGEMLK
jgi:SEC-C motif-containing protein